MLFVFFNLRSGLLDEASSPGAPPASGVLPAIEARRADLRGFSAPEEGAPPELPPVMEARRPDRRGLTASTGSVEAGPLIEARRFLRGFISSSDLDGRELRFGA